MAHDFTHHSFSEPFAGKVEVNSWNSFLDKIIWSFSVSPVFRHQDTPFWAVIPRASQSSWTTGKSWRLRASRVHVRGRCRMRWELVGERTKVVFPKQISMISLKIFEMSMILCKIFWDVHDFTPDVVRIPKFYIRFFEINRNKSLHNTGWDLFPFRRYFWGAL